MDRLETTAEEVTENGTEDGKEKRHILKVQTRREGMMSTNAQKLSPNVKAAFEKAGISLNPSQENIAAVHAGSIDWMNLLTNLGKLAATIIPIIISLLGLTPVPTPTPAQGSKAKGTIVGCPEHHCACHATFCNAVRTSHGALCLAETLSCTLSCEACDPCAMEAFHASLHEILNSVCTVHAAGHCLMDCCCCCDSAEATSK